MMGSRVRHCAEEIWKSFRPFYVIGDQRDNALMRALVTGLLDENSNAIDVGSHTGSFLSWFLRVAPRGQHTAIEPLPYLAAALRERYPTVIVHEVALSDTNGMATFHEVTSSPAYSGLQRSAYHTPQTVVAREVRTARLDDLLPADFPVSLMKIDVEGAEFQTLLGAARTIQRWRPAILFEHGFATANPYGTTPNKLHNLLSSYGLRVFSLNGDGPHSLEEFDARCSPRIKPQEWNFLARR